MGYDLHITRRRHWPDEGDDITAQEWLAYVKQDSELRLQPENGPSFAEWRGASGTAWLDWSDGQIYSKNPEAALIEKLVSIGRQLGAKVQGDDGEVYEGGGRPPRQPLPSFSERVTGWFARFRPKRSVPIVHEPLGFGVGDKVLDSWGNEHTVLDIDPKAEHGMGVIRTRRKDGTEHAHAMIAHGLKPSKDR
jgi:hypothetical protein